MIHRKRWGAGDRAGDAADGFCFGLASAGITAEILAVTRAGVEGIGGGHAGQPGELQQARDSGSRLPKSRREDCVMGRGPGFFWKSRGGAARKRRRG